MASAATPPLQQSPRCQNHPAPLDIGVVSCLAVTGPERIEKMGLKGATTDCPQILKRLHCGRKPYPGPIGNQQRGLAFALITLKMVRVGFSFIENKILIFVS